MNLQELISQLNTRAPGLWIVFLVITLTFVVLVVGGVWYFFFRPNSAVERARQEVEEAEDKAEQDRKSNRNIWEMSYYQQKFYVETNIQQNRSVYIITIIMIIAGIVMILIGLTVDILITPPEETGNSWAVIIAGLVTEFIAATILVVFRLVSQQSMEYFRTLERMTSIGIAINIVDNLPTEHKEKSLSEMARIILERQLGSSGSALSLQAGESKDKSS